VIVLQPTVNWRQCHVPGFITRSGQPKPKATFQHWESAQRYILARDFFYPDARPMRPYYCRLHHGWHIGHYD